MTIMYVDARTSVLLQTALAEVSGTDEDIKRVRNNCSQRSYVSTRLRDHMGLRSICYEKLMIMTFGTEEGQIQDCDVVQVCLQGIRSDLSSESALKHTSCKQFVLRYRIKPST